MNTEANERALLNEALELPTGERAAYLKGACRGDHELRARVERLLGAHQQGGALLETILKDEPMATVIDESQPREEGGLLIGRYKLLERLGEGGFGAVWLAEQKEPVRRKVALKIIKLGMDTRQVVARFEAERQALAMMDHPNIAKVLDAGTTDAGRPYFVMELVRGIPMTKFCDENQMPTKDRLDLFIKVCQAIQHAHQKGIIHRDIKPSNVLVTLHDGVPVPKVIDFGIAKATQGELTDKTIHTQFQQFIGTPAYMSPEQAEMSGLDIDTRSDLYSLGVLLYELLTGKTPFDAKELMALGVDVMRKTIREKEPVRPSTRLATLEGQERTTTAKRHAVEMPRLIHQLKGDLDWIAMKCLEKDRARRYDTANALAADIQRHLNNEAVLARPPSANYRFQKLVRRNKLAFAAAGTITMALIIGLGFSTWSYFGERAARALAEVQRKAADQARANEIEQRKKAEEAGRRETQQRHIAENSELSARRNLYAADMLLAFQALETGNLGHARVLMRKYLTEPGQKDLRGWEWRYLWQQCKGDEQFTLGTHSKGVTVAAFFPPDGRIVASASKDKTVKLWDLESRRLIDTLAHPDQVHALAISPDGRLFATGCDDGSIRLRNAATREVTLMLTNAPNVNTLFFSSDGKILGSGSSERAVLWDIATRRELASYPGNFWIGNLGFKAGIALSHDKRYLAFGQITGEIELWDWENNSRKAVLADQAGLKDFPLTLAFSTDGKYLVSGGNATATIWDVDTRREAVKLTNFVAWVGSAAFSPDGKILATASADQTVKLWSTKNWEEIATLRGHEFEVWWVAFSPDGTKLVTAAKDDSIKIWDLSARHQRKVANLPFRFTEHSSLSPDGQTLLVLYTNKTLSLTDTSTFGTETRSSPLGTNITRAAISSDRKLLAAAHQDGTIKMFDLSTLRELFKLPVKTLGWSIAFSPDGKFLAVPTGGRKIELWDTTDAHRIRELEVRPRLWAWSIASDSRSLAAGYYDGTVELWDLADGTKRVLPTGHEERIRSVTFSNNGRMLATTSVDIHLIKLWDVETGRELARLGGQFMSFGSMTFSPDDRRLAGGGNDGSVTLWDIANPQPQQVGKLNRHTGEVDYVSFLSDDDTLISFSSSDGLRVWRAPSWEEIAAAEAKEKPEIKNP